MIFTSSDNKIAYYHAPKNGSRTMLGYLSLVKQPDLFEKYPQYFHPTDDEVYSPLRERVGRHGKHHYETGLVPVADSEIRIVIKRDPVKRFISGYTNRVLHHKKLGNTPPPSFKHFVLQFDKFKARFADIETHFRPQYQFFGKNKEIFTHIFDTSEMHLVKELFQDTYQRPFPDLRLQQGGNKNKVELDKNLEKRIEKLYEVDYDCGWC